MSSGAHCASTSVSRKGFSSLLPGPRAPWRKTSAANLTNPDFDSSSSPAAVFEGAGRGLPSADDDAVATRLLLLPPQSRRSRNPSICILWCCSISNCGHRDRLAISPGVSSTTQR